MGMVSIHKWVYRLLLLFLLVAGLYYARPFLVPVSFAGLFAMLFLPLSAWLEGKGVNRIVAVILCLVLLLLAIGGIISLLYWQVSDLLQDIDRIEKNIMLRLMQLRRYISRSLGISEQQQQELLQGGAASLNLQRMLGQAVYGIGSLLTNMLLFVVYLFLLLYFRSHLKEFFLMLVPEERKGKTAGILANCSKVSQKYLSGLVSMIICLWVLYGIGFSVIGVKNALFFAILCGLLEIVPYLGNLTGNLITMMMVFAQGGSPAMVLGVLITYACIQFFQTYVLEPLVVGSGVNINPLFTIAGLVAGELVWGIPGMVLAIPGMGIVKIICDNVDGLKPYGFLLGGKKKRGKE